MPLDVGKLGYPIQPASPGESIFEQASAAQMRLDKLHEKAEDSMMQSFPMEAWKDEELVMKRNNFLADPFHCNPDEYHPK